MACNSKTAGPTAKSTEIWYLETLVPHIWGAFKLVVFWGPLGAYLKMACDSEKAGSRVRRTD